MNRNKLSSQRGAAIIVALFVMTLVAACSVAMLFRLNIEIKRTELIMNADQATLYAQGSIDWAIEQLRSNLANPKPGQVTDKLPLTSETSHKQGYAITSTIEDMQGKLNINDLQETSHRDHFNRLVHLLLPNLQPEQITQIGDAIVDWISYGKETAFASYYQKQRYPYQAPHKPMVSISELRLVRGVTPEIYRTLLPYLSALPQKTKLNINSASWEVLYSLSPQMSPDTAKAIQAQCQRTPFSRLEEAQGFDLIKNNPLPSDVDVVSSYFLVKTSVKVGDQQIRIYTLLQRSLQENHAVVKRVWQSKGTL